MPKELIEISKFTEGIISTPSDTDTPVESASYSTNIDPITEDGKLKGIPDESTKVSTVDAIVFGKIKHQGKHQTVFHDGEPSGSFQMIDDLGHASPTSSVLGISGPYTGTPTMETNNKELHVGMGSGVLDAPKWVGHIPFGQFGASAPSGIQIENAELSNPSSFPTFDKMCTNENTTTIYGLRVNEKYIYKFDVASKNLLDRSADDTFPSNETLKTFCIDDADDNFIWILTIDDVGSGEFRLYRMDGRNLQIDYSCKANTSANDSLNFDGGYAPTKNDIVHVKGNHAKGFIWITGICPNLSYQNKFNLWRCEAPTIDDNPFSVTFVKPFTLFDSLSSGSFPGPPYRSVPGQFIAYDGAWEPRDIFFDTPANCLFKPSGVTGSTSPYVGVLAQICIVDNETDPFDVDAKADKDVYYVHTSGCSHATSTTCEHRHMVYEADSNEFTYNVTVSSSSPAYHSFTPTFKIKKGMRISGTGVPTDTYVQSVTLETSGADIGKTTGFVASNNSTQSLTDQSISFRGAHTRAGQRFAYGIHCALIMKHDFAANDGADMVAGSASLDLVLNTEKDTFISDGKALVYLGEKAITGHPAGRTMPLFDEKKGDGTDYVNSVAGMNDGKLAISFDDQAASNSASSNMWTITLPNISTHKGTGLDGGDNTEVSNQSPDIDWDATTGTAISIDQALGVPTWTGAGTARPHIFGGPGSTLARWAFGELDSVAAYLEDTISIEITEESGGDLADTTEVEYKASFTYDEYQESPLTSFVLAKKTVSGANKKHRLLIKNKAVDIVSKRLSHINIYASKNTGFYRLVQSISLMDAWKTVDSETTNPDWGNYHEKEIIYYGVSKGSYESITGISETLTNTIVNYGLSTQLNNTLYVADCYHRDIKDSELYMFKSQPYNLDQFDYTVDLLRLPTKPTAIKAFNHRIYVFDENNTYKINPQNMYIEDTFEGVGCIGPKSIIVTEYGMCFCDQNNIYLHDGYIPKAIGDKVLRGNDLSWQSKDPGWDPMVTFDSINKSFLIAFKRVGYTIYSHLAYNIPRQRWDIWSINAEPKVHVTGVNGEVYYSNASDLKQINSTGNKTWTWTSQKFTLDQATQDKVFTKVRFTGVNTDINPTITSSKGTVTSAYANDTDNASYTLSGANRQAKWIQIALSGLTTEEIDSIGIVYRRKMKLVPK